MRMISLLAGSMSVLLVFSLSLPVFAEGTTTTTEISRMMQKGMKKGTRGQDKSMKKVNAVCMGPAVTAREDALIAGLQARKTALVAAWSVSEMDPRKSAIKAAMEAWKAAKKAAWEAYRTAVKGCGESPAEEAMGEAL